jgi:HEAT repeat protein
MNDERWAESVRELHDLRPGSRAVEAAAELQRTASEEDIPRLLTLLRDDSFFVREAAAWPLSDLGVTSALPELLEAQHVGVQEGWDNDGLNAAIADLVETRPHEASAVLRQLVQAGPAHLREGARWALEFAGDQGDV